MLHLPKNEAELLEILSRWPVQAFWAGATDLSVALQRGQVDLSPESHHVDLHALKPQWSEIRVHHDALEIGALTTVADLLASPLVRDLAPVLHAAAREFGSPPIRNMATVGGNLANASPAADLWPPLLVLEAQIELLSPRGTRRVPLEAFYTGYRQTVREPHEVIRRIRIPSESLELPFYYRKVGLRQSQAIAVVSLAAVRTAEGAVRMAAGAVNPTVQRLRSVELLLNAGETPTPSTLKQALASDIHPISDVRATAAYRFAVTLNLVQEAWRSLRDG